MSFVKEYTNVFPAWICNCLLPYWPKALKKIRLYRCIKEINRILLIKTHDIKFVMYFLLKSNIHYHH